MALDRTFKGFNSSNGEICPICGGGDDKETVLIPIDGTQSGNNCQAMQFHLECILKSEFQYNQDMGILYLKVEVKAKSPNIFQRYIMKTLKFRLRIDNKIVGYEKWYSGEFGEITSAKPQWLFSNNGKQWNPNYIYHKQKDQYTGLKDKEAREIYEGDIIKIPICKKYPDGSISLTESEWKIEVVEFGTSDIFHGYNLGRFNTNRTEIIGNIFEQPELYIR